MMIKKLLISIGFISGILIFIQCRTTENNIEITTMRCEYLEDPIGIDEPQPHFTWSIQAGEWDIKQTAYQIQFASTPELLEQGIPDIWQSDKEESFDQLVIFNSPEQLSSFKKYYWNIKVWTTASKEPIISGTASFETSMMNKDDWSAKWITDSHDKDYEPAPLFRKTFETAENKIVDYARLYISALGYYEAYINGNRIGNSHLDPSYTDFNKRVYYVTHDVTELISVGNNVISAVLGNGWFNEQSVAVWDFHNASWRDRPKMIGELHIHYTDGTVDKITTDTTWKTNTGAYIYNNIYSGDMYDSRLEEKGWKQSDFDDHHWNNGLVTDLNVYEFRAQKLPPIQVTKEINPVNFVKINDSIYVYDFGENFSGFSRIRIKGEKGTKLLIKHGELLDSVGRLNQGNIDVYYHPVQEKEKFQTDVFIISGDNKYEEFQPSFTYHGFQYVEIESDRPIELTEKSLTGLFIHTNVDTVGSFSCSNETLNKLWKATNQSYLSNLHSIPTDCPQREKNGWTADAHVAAELGLLNYDGILFYEKWMKDFIDNQRENGMISGIIPSSGWGFGDWPGPVWDAALFIIPNELYNYYGDKHCIIDLYPTMEKYLNYLDTKAVDGLLNYGLGDWLTYKTQTLNAFTSTAYYYLDYKLMARFAEIAGKESKVYNEKAETLKKLINEQFYNSETNIYANGSQTSQALALFLGLAPVEDEQKVADQLAEVVKSNRGFVDFGLLGTKTVPRMLTEYGYADIALKMLIRPESPSWGYWVDSLGYTTLPETWTLSPKYNDASLNHVFFGDISAWMYRYLAGINYDNQNTGFKHIVIQPYFVDGIDWVKAEYKSVRGPVRSEWKRKGTKAQLYVEIPAGSTATMKINNKEKEIGSGKHSFTVNID
mgnify:CR=1 FL=1